MTIAHITMATRDVPRTAQFFETVLGWRPLHHPENITMNAAWLEIVPGQQVHLLHVPDFEPSPFEREFGRHVALFHSTADFDALKKRLVENGAELIDAKRATPFSRFFFRDPNGYVFEVVEQEGFLAE